MGFERDEDIYAKDTQLWTKDDWYMCYRWLARVVTKSPRKPYYANILKSMDIEQMNREAQVMLYVLINEIPRTRQLLTREQEETLATIEPLDYRLILDDDPIYPENYMKMGIVL